MDRNGGVRRVDSTERVAMRRYRRAPVSLRGKEEARSDDVAGFRSELSAGLQRARDSFLRLRIAVSGVKRASSSVKRGGPANHHQRSAAHGS